MEFQNIEITPFDNDISILYKWADLYKIPRKYVLPVSEIRDNKEYITYVNGLVEIAGKVSIPEKAVEDVIVEYEDFDNISVDDILMIYAFYNRSDSDVQKVTNINNVRRQYDIVTDLKDENDLRLEKEEWLRNFNDQKEYDLDSLDRILEVHEILAGYPALYVSPLLVEKATLVTYPQLTYTSSDKVYEEGLDIFDKAIVTPVNPYIQYNEVSNKSTTIDTKFRPELFKLYKGKTVEDRPDYNLVKPKDSDIRKDDHLYMSLWTGTGDIKRATKESFTTVSWDLNKNKLSVKAPISEEGNDSQIVLERITNSLPITIDEVQETAVSGSFYIFDIDINDIYLVDMILNDDILSSYLFVKEDTKPYALKKQLKLYYKTLDIFDNKEDSSKVASSVTISINQNYAKGGEIVEALATNYPLPSQIQRVQLKKTQAYIRVKITDAESREVAEHFMFVFSTLLHYYKANKDAIERIYTTIIPELLTKEPVKMITKTVTGKKVKEESKITSLKRLAPEIFVGKYSRKVQKANQPVIIPPDQVQVWKTNNKIMYEGKEIDRPVLPFPPNNPRLYFSCEGNDYPFIGVIENTLENREEYPCLPKCFNNLSFANKTLAKCTGEGPKAKKTGHMIKTDKIVKPGLFGYLPKNVSSLISQYSKGTKKILRMGMPYSVSSLLHCVSVALNDARYKALTTDEEKEQYIRQLRNLLVTDILPALFSQELYDYSEVEIRQLLTDPDVFLDPDLFYRGVEQLYNISIYTFEPPKNGDQDYVGIRYPRFKLFHSRAPRPNRRTVLIYRTWGSESDNLKYPQCELIVDRDEESDRLVTQYNQDMTVYMHNTMLNLNRIISWNIYDKTISAQDNIYSQVNYYELFRKIAVGQMLDNYGKMRGLVLPAQQLNPQIADVEVTILFPSSQPENLPLREITRVSSVIATQVITDTPTARTVDENGLTNGLWFRLMDLVFGLYIPVNPEKVLEDLYIGPNNPLETAGTDITARLFKLNRDLEIILQVTVWLYLLSGTDVNNFAKNYTYYGTGTTRDSSTVYDLSNIGRKFPNVSTYEEGVRELSKLVPTLFVKDRIYFYSNKFSQGIYYFLQRWEKDIRTPETVLPTMIRRSHLIPEDFSMQAYTAIFTDAKDMNTWLSTLDSLSYKNLQILEKLEVSKFVDDKPYIYATATGNMYLVQNVIGGELSRAISVALNWYLNKINSGYNTAAYDKAFPVHVIYGISASKDLILKVNNSAGNSNYLQILDYGNDQYSALLKLV